MTMRVVVAPDSFKGSATAREAATAIAAGWREVRPRDDLLLLPQADGGEGTLDAIEAATPGAVRRSAGAVTGPDGSPTPGEWLELPGDRAVVELAQMCGLPLMTTLDALGASTRGLGEVIVAALAAGAREVIVGLGGSASTDGGAGALSAMGLRSADQHGAQIADGGGALRGIAATDVSGLATPPPGGVTLLTDVTAPLLGPTGAAAVFGPQKGASPSDVDLLEAGLAHFARSLGGDPHQPGSGAAGGTAFGFATTWNALIRSGAAHIAELTGLIDAMSTADVLLTGEGRFDGQSLTGKTVGYLLDVAPASPVRVGIIAGQIDVAPPVWSTSLTGLAGSSLAARKDPLHWLRVAGRQAAAAFGRPANGG